MQYDWPMAEARTAILFVCVHNAGRSQMAAGLTRKLAGDDVAVRSAGSDPADEINPAAIEAMSEIGVDISTEVPKLLESDAVRVADVVVRMGCGDECPFIRAKAREDWNITDPKEMPPDEFRNIRNLIESRVKELLSRAGGDH